jgi:hypothetical protein
MAKCGDCKQFQYPPEEWKGRADVGWCRANRGYYNENYPAGECFEPRTQED